jgi:hypothetical protein
MRLGTIEAPDEAAAFEKAAAIQGVGREVDAEKRGVLKLHGNA